MKSKTCSLILLFLAIASLATARSYVVLVGVADYPGSKNDLRLSGRDAATMKQLYERNGDAATDVLTDREATVQSVLVAMGNLFDKATADDCIVLFFSGHGVPGGFVCYDGLLRYDAVTAIMKKSKARQKLILADACYAGKARKSNKHVVQESDDEVVFFLSSRTNEQSIERRTWRNSLFTAWLERGLRGGADANRDRTVTARELFDFVSQGVNDTSGGRQHPVMWGRFSDDTPVMTWKKETKSEK